VPRRLALLAALLTSTLSAQFYRLSSTADGSSIYFATTLFLRGTPRLLNGKIFVATQDGIRLFQAREPSSPPADALPCTAGGFIGYSGAETSSAGVVALSYGANSNDGGCSFPINTFMTQIVTAAGDDASLRGIVRLSAGGRYALVYLAATGRLYTSFVLSFLDLRTGAQTPVRVPAPVFPEYVPAPYGGGRVIADDGTAVLGVTDGSHTRHGYILKPGADAAPFPIADGMPLIIDAAASKVLYQKQDGVYLLDLGTVQSTALLPADQPASGFRMSDDARRLLFLRDGQVHVLDTATVSDRTLTSDAAKITEATISGDGKTVFAVTGIGRLLKIDVDAGSQIELIGHTPYLASFGDVPPGFTMTLHGSGLSDSVINGTVPLNNWLGNVTMWIGERKVPVTQLTPNSVSIIVPWDIQSDGGSIRIQAEAPGDHTPFYFPEVMAPFYPGRFPSAGAIARQDWTQTYVGPINTGEIIHVYAIGFGPVFPDVPEGTAAPSAEPFSRITQSLTCSNAEILYAGLSPGTVERVYQLDIRIGPTAGYQKFLCSLGGAEPFNFLTLNIVP
jgi:uncharacterized protein (TIGR03437 family)